MFGNLLRKLWNRRKDRRRLALSLTIRATGAGGRPFEAISEDISDSGVRLRSAGQSAAQLLGHQDLVEMEVNLKEGALPVKVQARLIWAYSASQGGAMSGWCFAHFRGNARRRLRAYLDACETDMDEDQTE